MEHESDVYTNCNWCSWYSHQRINKGTGGLGNKRTRGDHSNNSIVEIGLNTEKNHGDVRRLAVTQTLVNSAETDVKNFQFDLTNKWYMHNPAPVLENDSHKLLWDFNIKNGSPNSGQKIRPHNNQQKKKKEKKR